MDLFLTFLLLLAIFLLLVLNLKLYLINCSLKRELFQRERWHERELAKWRQRL